MRFYPTWWVNMQQRVANRNNKNNSAAVGYFSNGFIVMPGQELR
jgi:hypothetical protein